MSATPPVRRASHAIGAIARVVRPRRWRLLAFALGLGCYALLWAAELHANDASHSALFGLLVTAPVLVVLVGAGNLLSDWVGVRRRGPRFADPDAEPASDEGGPPA